MSTPVASKQHCSLRLKKCLEVEFVSVLLKTDLKLIKLWLNWLQNSFSCLRFPLFKNILFFFNPSRLVCSDNIEVSRKMSQIIDVRLW